VVVAGAAFSATHARTRWPPPADCADPGLQPALPAWRGAPAAPSPRMVARAGRAVTAMAAFGRFLRLCGESPIAGTPHMQRRKLIALALATALVALPAASQQGKGPKTQVYIDVATHDFAGMPGLGGLGGFMMRRMGGDKGPQAHPESRNVPGATGKYLDIALYNGLKPGVEATQYVPAGLDVGKSLPLVPPVA